MDQIRELASVAPTAKGDWDAMDFWLPVAVVFIANMLFGVFC